MTYMHLFTEEVIASDYVPLKIIKFFSEYVFHTATSLPIIHMYRLKSVTLYINIHTYIHACIVYPRENKTCTSDYFCSTTCQLILKYTSAGSSNHRMLY